MPTRSRSALLLLLVALLAAGGLWFLVARPVPPLGAAAAGSSPGGGAGQLPGATTPGHAPGSPAAGARDPEAAGGSSGTCRVGTPQRLVIPALGVNAAFQPIGLDPTARPDASGRQPLGTPTDKTRAGWYAAGPRPGAGTGTVLTNGHTYRDGSAIFKEDFAARIAVGQRIDVRMDNGSVCSYAVSQAWRVVPKSEYPRIVASQHLYDFSGPERLFLTTCGGSWNALAQNYDDNSIVIATPVNR